MNKKVYFAGSIRGGRVDAALYQKIINYIKKTDIVLTEHIGKSNMSLKAQTKEIDVHLRERYRVVEKLRPRNSRMHLPIPWRGLRVGLCRSA